MQNYIYKCTGVPLRGEGSCGGGGAPRDSAGSGATEEGLTSRGGRHLRLPLRFGLRPQGPCRVGTGESGLIFIPALIYAGLFFFLSKFYDRLVILTSDFVKQVLYCEIMVFPR